MLKAVVLLCCLVLASAHDRPIIGILTVGPTSETCPTFGNATVNDGGGCFTSKNCLDSNWACLRFVACFDCCVSVYYPKWVESAGGRVVPIRYNAPKAELDALFARQAFVLHSFVHLRCFAVSTAFCSRAAV